MLTKFFITFCDILCVILFLLSRCNQKALYIGERACTLLYYIKFFGEFKKTGVHAVVKLCTCVIFLPLLRACT